MPTYQSLSDRNSDGMCPLTLYATHKVAPFSFKVSFLILDSYKCIVSVEFEFVFVFVFDQIWLSEMQNFLCVCLRLCVDC